MFKRLFWLVTGIAFGVTMAMSVQRAVRRRARRLRPERLARDLVDIARAAVAEGRAGMREREAELRSKLEGRVATPS